MLIISLSLLLAGAIGAVVAQNKASCPFVTNGTNYLAGFSSELKYAKNFKLLFYENSVALDIPSSNLMLHLYMCNLAAAPNIADGDKRIPIKIPISGAAVSGFGVNSFIKRLGLSSRIASSTVAVNSDECLKVPVVPTPLPEGQFEFDRKFSQAFSVEESPLAMGEWIKVFGLFFGPDGIRAADREFGKMTATFDCVKDVTTSFRSTAPGDSIPVIGAFRADGKSIIKDVDDKIWTSLAATAGANYSTLPSDAVDIPGWDDQAKKLDILFDFSEIDNEKYDMASFQKNYNKTTVPGVYPFLDNTASKVYRFDLLINEETGIITGNHAMHSPISELLYTIAPTFNPGKDGKSYYPYWFKKLNNAPGPIKQDCSKPLALYLDGAYCDKSWKFTPEAKKVFGGSGSTNGPPQGSGTDGTQGSSLNPISTIFIVAAVLAVGAGCVAAFLLLKAKKRGENDRRFFEIGSRGSILYQRRDDLQNGITLQDMSSLRSGKEMAFQTDSKTTLWMGELEPWMDENYVRQLCISDFGSPPSGSWWTLNLEDVFQWTNPDLSIPIRFSLNENVNVKMIRDKVSGASAGYCFVDFSSHASAMRLLNSVNGSLIPGTNKVFKLNWASGGGMVDRREQGGPEYSIFVGDLGAEVTDLLLMNTFQSRYSSVKAGKVVTDPSTGMSRGYGFVRFADEMDQQRAMAEMNGQYCGSRPMRIASATPKNKPGGSGTPSMMGMGMQMNMGMGMQGMMGMPQGMGMQGGYYGMPPQGMPMQGMQQHLPQQGQQMGFGMGGPAGYNPFTDPSNTTVFIGGLNPGVTDDDLKSNFGQFGEILHTKIPPGRGCGFVTFAHRQSAEVAIQQMNNAIIGGARVRLSWGKAQSSSKAPNQYGNQGGYLPQGQGHLGNEDQMHTDPVERLNESYISQREGTLERIDVEGTGWRGGQKQVYAQ
ncbi:hypothetical protein HDU97_004347 [Phlyctochytrium planicorne]|nr:hypothetical protein HDU97_004347 [Phlyctochytrium planicorne]